MKVDQILSVALTDHGYDVTIKTSGGNIAIAHTDEDWVIQSVSRIEVDSDNNKSVQGRYSVIPQQCRVAVSEIKGDQSIANALLYDGVWYNKDHA